MVKSARDVDVAERYVRAVRAFIDRDVARLGSTAVVKPGHRVPFHWPPHPISYNYHVLASDWRGNTEVDLFGEKFEVRLAKTAHGVFGRCEALWTEAKGKSEAEMAAHLRTTVEPLFKRQTEIGKCLNRDGRFQGAISDLENEDLLALLYCSDRDVASSAQIALETRPNKPNLLGALLEILSDDRHPNRRSAQWCVLDLFEDMPAFCIDESDELEAIDVIKRLIMTAPDDYARTVFKAGVVLGGHLPDLHGGPALLECLDAPSRIGRRSAIHGLFHVVEWHPELRDEVVQALQKVSITDPDKQLREYATMMAHDIETDQLEHIEEPMFDNEE